MKISVNWLKDYVALDEPVDVLACDLSLLGLAVDTVEKVGSDAILELDVTANRPDCLNHFGVARELSAAYRTELKKPGAPVGLLPKEPRTPVSISIDEAELCHRYCGLVIQGIQVKPSPGWLQERLMAIGQRTINNIVDITNYVLLEFGHPLHAFDYCKLKNNKIVVRRALPGESILTIEREQHALNESMLVIADDSEPVALAGVMGGALSEVNDMTTDILLESAWFLPKSIRRTSKTLGLSSEASYRFERGADLSAPPSALMRTAHLILEMAGGEIASPLIDVFPTHKKLPTITLRKSQIKRLVGVDVAPAFVDEILSRLEFRIVKKNDTSWEIIPPSFRADVKLEADLIEEVARFFGYNNLPATLPEFSAQFVQTPDVRKRERVREYFKESGFQEILTTSFVEEKKDSFFDFYKLGGKARIDNPLAEEEPFMRTNLIGGMVGALKFNENNYNKDVRLFEIGAAYCQHKQGGQYSEEERLVIGVFGNFLPGHWEAPGMPVDFFHLKGILDRFFLQFGLGDLSFERAENVDFLQPGNSALIKRGRMILGFIGQLNELTAREWKFRQNIFLGEIQLKELFRAHKEQFSFLLIPRFPYVDRDVSFTVDNTVSYGKIEEGLFNLKIPELYSIELFDLYKGKDVPKGLAAITIRLVFQDPERTLTDSEVDKLRDRVSNFLVKKFKINFR